jgi:hypothetical protein
MEIKDNSITVTGDAGDPEHLSILLSFLKKIINLKK